MVNNKLSFWAGKRILVTGHTGFKGSWLMIWLKKLGAIVYGFSLSPQDDLNIFKSLPKDFFSEMIHHNIGDIRNRFKLEKIIKEAKPDIVFHLAAQPIVKIGYEEPINTWETNLMGSLNLLQSLKDLNQSCSVVVVTTDKVYKNNEWVFGYREIDQLGGHDPYSASKAALEIAVSSWRDSFCMNNTQGLQIKIATARAGNVIGGGDWAPNRIVPDVIKSLISGKELIIRNPDSTRPWQHVLEPLWGYMLLAKAIYENNQGYNEPFNFGPGVSSNRKVKEVVEKIFELWPGKYSYARDPNSFYEANKLFLHIDKAIQKLDWTPKIGFEKSIEKTTLWYKNFHDGKSALDCCISDINYYQELI